jgi:hypothetical protein
MELLMVLFPLETSVAAQKLSKVKTRPNDSLQSLSM